MNILSEQIKTLKNVEKLIKKHGNKNDPEPMEIWNLMGLYNPWYVIIEKNNIIKFTWEERFQRRKICVIVKWENSYNECILIYNDSDKYKDENKILKLNKDDINKLEEYIYNNDYFNYRKIEDIAIQTGGSTHKLEVKINGKYNIEDDDYCSNNKIIYDFANILFKLAVENP